MSVLYCTRWSFVFHPTDPDDLDYLTLLKRFYFLTTILQRLSKFRFLYFRKSKWQQTPWLLTFEDFCFALTIIEDESDEKTSHCSSLLNISTLKDTVNTDSYFVLTRKIFLNPSSFASFGYNEIYLYCRNPGEKYFGNVILPRCYFIKDFESISNAATGDKEHLFIKSPSSFQFEIHLSENSFSLQFDHQKVAIIKQMFLFKNKKNQLKIPLNNNSTICSLMYNYYQADVYFANLLMWHFEYSGFQFFVPHLPDMICSKWDKGIMKHVLKKGQNDPYQDDYFMMSYSEDMSDTMLFSLLPCFEKHQVPCTSHASRIHWILCKISFFEKDDFLIQRCVRYLSNTKLKLQNVGLKECRILKQLMPCHPSLQQLTSKFRFESMKKNTLFKVTTTTHLIDGQIKCKNCDFVGSVFNFEFGLCKKCRMIKKKYPYLIKKTIEQRGFLCQLCGSVHSEKINHDCSASRTCDKCHTKFDHPRCPFCSNGFNPLLSNRGHNFTFDIAEQVRLKGFYCPAKDIVIYTFHEIQKWKDCLERGKQFRFPCQICEQKTTTGCFFCPAYICSDCIDNLKMGTKPGHRFNPNSLLCPFCKNILENESKIDLSKYNQDHDYYTCRLCLSVIDVGKKGACEENVDNTEIVDFVCDECVPLTDKIKTCPSCKMAVDKFSGCNTLKCRCNHSFCWLCLHPRTESKQHFCFT